MNILHANYTHKYDALVSEELDTSACSRKMDHPRVKQHAHIVSFDDPLDFSKTDDDVYHPEKLGLVPETTYAMNDRQEDHKSAISDAEFPFSPCSPSSHSSSLDDELDRDDDIAIFDDDTATSPDAAKFQPVVPLNVDELVARQMAELSMAEREKVLFDIHGVSDEVPETDVDLKLNELDFHLQHVSSRQALDMAIKLCPAYVSDREFRLSFLRADLLDPQKAAQRFARHFQAKLDLFGLECLVKDITQDDLDTDTLHALYSGLSQYLPLRDRAGRLVHVSFHHPDEISLQAKLKRTFYMCMVSNEDIETQRKGRVAVGYLAGQQVLGTPRNDWQVGKLLNALPVRITAVHLCHDTPSIWSPIFAMFKYVVTLFTRLRIREHCGTNAECILSLQTFGIPTCLPLEETESGYVRVTNDENTRFWQKRRTLERLRKRQAEHPQESITISLQATTGQEDAVVRPSTSLSASVTTAIEDPLSARISIPWQNDVLLGRGKGFYQHTGNIRFRYWIESRSRQYDQATTSAEKKRITMEVIQLVREGGGRFLRDEKCGWIEVNDETARQKVAHVFRSLRVLSNAEVNDGDRKIPKDKSLTEIESINKRARR